jgi:1-deoxy-D-xylulose-5-phosphate synthase
MNTIAIPSLAELKNHSLQQLTELSEQIRRYLIDTISKTGGHIGANLGVVELSVALHHVFDSPQDRLLFDTGHQGYTHKLLTGRRDLFPSLNTPDGMSRFLDAQESEHDVLSASHAGTAIPTGTGLALASKLAGNAFHVVSVVGDGAFVEGLSFEGLNYAPEQKLPLIVVVNDNGMAIAPNIGGVKALFSGEDWEEKARNFFNALGYTYLPVRDGHHLPDLVAALRQAKTDCLQGPVLVHARTEKGKGLSCADGHKYKMHFSMPFDPETGTGAAPTPPGESYARVASRTLKDLMTNDETITVMTPATPYASELDDLLQTFPERTLDVGMAEQHALSMAAGLALAGRKPVACLQSTFMQRAMDQILHDVAYPNLPVTILAARSGFAGFDGPTHHGIYDFSYLQAVPNLKLFYAGTAHDLDAILRWRMRQPQGPMVICHPYEAVRQGEVPPREGDDILTPECLDAPAEVCLVSPANRLGTALDVKRRLEAEGKRVAVINLRWIKPFPEKTLLPYLAASRVTVCLEENISSGGVGMRLAALCADRQVSCRLLRIAIPDGFVAAGNKAELSLATNIDAASICEKIDEALHG